MSTQTLLRRILSLTLWTLRKTLATAVALALVAASCFALIVVALVLVGVVREMGAWDFAKGLATILVMIIALSALCMWAFNELSGDS